MKTSVSYRKITLSAVKEQLLGNFWAIVITLSVGPILMFVQWLIGARMNFSINGFDILDNIIAGEFTWIAPTGLVVILMTAFVAWIASIVNAATARTYLGAGMSRRAILAMNMKVWLASALSMTVVATVALLAHFIAIGDFSGNIAVRLPEDFTLPFDIPAGILWWAPLRNIPPHVLRPQRRILRGPAVRTTPLVDSGRHSLHPPRPCPDTSWLRH